MKIAILSDTHSKVKRANRALEHLIHKGAEFIIHAGDIVKPEVLESIKSSKLRYVAVYGNNDTHLHSVHNQFNIVQEPYYFKLASSSFKLMHLPFYLTPDADIVIFGHTHTFECDFKNGTLFLNPGEACARNKNLSECALLEVNDAQFIVTYCYRTPGEKIWYERHYMFERN